MPLYPSEKEYDIDVEDDDHECPHCGHPCDCSAGRDDDKDCKHCGDAVDNIEGIDNAKIVGCGI